MAAPRRDTQASTLAVACLLLPALVIVGVVVAV
jgi:hypothetical protein